MSEKYIKKDLLKLAVIEVLNEPPFSEKKFERAKALIKVIDEFPAADVEPVVRARWQDGKCTNCGCYGLPTYDGGNERTPFCPFCGAHMMERSGSGE